MKIKKRFTLYNIIMLMTPIILIGVVSVGFLLIFIMKYPVEELLVKRSALINPRIFAEAVGLFFQNNPGAIRIVFIWFAISAGILIFSTTIITMIMSRSIKKPIDNLHRAAEYIRRGNLDFEVLGSDYDEINALCSEFDNMRRDLKYARQLEHSLKSERSMLLANLSHDLKTPITSIKGYIEGIRDGVADSPEKVSRYLDVIYQKADTIENMVNNLSSYSRLELNREEFKFQTGELGKFLLAFCKKLETEFIDKDINLEYEFKDNEIPVRIDIDKMSRVFSNLVDNAVKYKKEGCLKLIIRTYPADGGVYAEVSDNGIGISPDEISKVFNSFYRIDESRSIKGSGLGLGIVKQIIEKHGGKIWLQSDGKKSGTTAVIFLPAAY